jgi:cell division protein FtsX
MEEAKLNTGQNLGTAALITSIVTFVMAIIPCIGIIAIIPGIIAVILASVGLSQASRSNTPKGTLTASLIIGIVAILISICWGAFFAGKIAKNADSWSSNIEKVVNEVQKNIEDDLKDANISIKIENGNDKIEITTSSNKDELEQTLEDLEQGNNQKNDTTPVIREQP